MNDVYLSIRNHLLNSSAIHSDDLSAAIKAAHDTFPPVFGNLIRSAPPHHQNLINGLKTQHLLRKVFVYLFLSFIRPEESLFLKLIDHLELCQCITDITVQDEVLPTTPTLEDMEHWDAINGEKLAFFPLL